MRDKIKLMRSLVCDFQQEVENHPKESPYEERLWRDVELKCEGIKDRLMEIDNELIGLLRNKSPVE